MCARRKKRKSRPCASVVEGRKSLGTWKIIVFSRLPGSWYVLELVVKCKKPLRQGSTRTAGCGWRTIGLLLVFRDIVGHKVLVECFPTHDRHLPFLPTHLRTFSTILSTHTPRSYRNQR